VSELHIPALEIAIWLPLIGALWVFRERDGTVARRHSLGFFGASFLCATIASFDFGTLQTFEAHDRWDVASRLFGPDTLVIDELSAPLIPLAALLYLLTGMATLRTKVQRVSFSGLLFSESILLATLSCKDPWGIIVLLALGTVPPFLELRQRGKSTRCYALHMGPCLVLLVIGWGLISQSPANETPSVLGITALMAAILIRSGCVPVHCWMMDLFEKATFATAILFVTPMVGAYAAMRLLVPVAPDYILRLVALISLLTAVYAAGMSLVQREGRRFYCYLLLSHASLVLVGLELATAEGLAGGLAVWLSVGLSLGGFGLTLRAVEARVGRISLASFHGLYDHMPMLASFFLLTGLASVGFPGTIGFIATELLVDGAVQVYPYSGMVIVLATAFNGIAVLQAFFKVFTGTRHTATVSLRMRRPERVGVLALTGLILGGGLYPQPGIASRHHAAVELLAHRQPSVANPHQGGHPGASDDDAHDALPSDHFAEPPDQSPQE